MLRFVGRLAGGEDAARAPLLSSPAELTPPRIPPVFTAESAAFASEPRGLSFGIHPSPSGRSHLLPPWDESGLNLPEATSHTPWQAVLAPQATSRVGVKHFRG